MYSPGAIIITEFLILTFSELILVTVMYLGTITVEYSPSFSPVALACKIFLLVIGVLAEVIVKMDKINTRRFRIN